MLSLQPPTRRRQLLRALFVLRGSLRVLAAPLGLAFAAAAVFIIVVVPEGAAALSLAAERDTPPTRASRTPSFTAWRQSAAAASSSRAVARETSRPPRVPYQAGDTWASRRVRRRRPCRPAAERQQNVLERHHVVVMKR